LNIGNAPCLLRKYNVQGAPLKLISIYRVIKGG